MQLLWLPMLLGITTHTHKGRKRLVFYFRFFSLFSVFVFVFIFLILLHNIISILFSFISCFSRNWKWYLYAVNVVSVVVGAVVYFSFTYNNSLSLLPLYCRPLWYFYLFLFFAFILYKMLLHIHACIHPYICILITRVCVCVCMLC